MSNDHSRKLDDLLTRHFKTVQDDPHSAARVMTRLAAPLPRQKGKLFGDWLGVLLDWQFAPAWPRVAALACCVAAGLAIGFSGLDRRIGTFQGGVSVASAADLGAVVFEPEPLTGARP